MGKCGKVLRVKRMKVLLNAVENALERWSILVTCPLEYERAIKGK